MKKNHKAKYTFCTPEHFCDWLSWSLRSTNGNKIGMSVFNYINMNTGEYTRKIVGYVKEPHPKEGYIGSISINACPFCGTKFKNGNPLPIEGVKDENVQ